jgi:hypothetical protein
MLIGLTRNGTIGFSAALWCGLKPCRVDSATMRLLENLPRLACRCQRLPFTNCGDAKGGLQCRDSGFGVGTSVVAINSNRSRAMRRRA